MKLLILLLLTLMSLQSIANSNTLAACPSSPNCVSTMASDNHAIKPFVLLTNTPFDMLALSNAIQQLDSRITINWQDNHLHAEISSRFLGFIDDLHLIVDQDKQRIHVRSASRLGYYDFGVNRKRVTKLRNILTKEGFIQ